MIRVVTDSAADLPAAISDAAAIAVVPLTVRFGDEAFTDGVDLDHDEFWRRLGDGSGLPETAAPSAGAFLDAFTRLAGEGADGVVAITISGRLSATHQAAVIAAERVADTIPVRVVDSRTVSLALGLAAVTAAEVAAAGGTLEEVATAAVAAAAQMHILAALDTLEYLQRGGRVGSVQAMLGGLLDVKPLISVDQGVVVPAGRVRTRTKARAAIVACAADNASAARIGIFHGGADDIDELEDPVRAMVGSRLVVAEMGPVVGTHAGPGAIGLAFQRG